MGCLPKCQLAETGKGTNSHRNVVVIGAMDHGEF